MLVGWSPMLRDCRRAMILRGHGGGRMTGLIVRDGDRCGPISIERAGREYFVALAWFHMHCEVPGFHLQLESCQVSTVNSKACDLLRRRTSCASYRSVCVIPKPGLRLVS